MAYSTGGDDGKEPISAPLPWALALGGAVGELQCIGTQCMWARANVAAWIKRTCVHATKQRGVERASSACGTPRGTFSNARACAHAHARTAR